MESSMRHGLEFCSFYNKDTRRCRIDGTSWCAFPEANYCDLSSVEVAKEHRIPTVILEIRRQLVEEA